MSEAKDVPLNICLIEDLTIRGGAQLWLVNCAARLSERGHTVRFILPTDSLILDDCKAIGDCTTYDREAIANDPEAFREPWTEALRPCSVAITLVRQKRGEFQNVSFAASCIVKAGLPTYLIAKTGTPDPTYEASFYGGELLEQENRCSVITISEFTRQFIIDKFGIAADRITTVYNGTDTSRFKPLGNDGATEARRRYPLPDDAGPIVGCIGSFEQRKGQVVLLEAAASLIKDGRLPNIHVLMVGEGPDKEMLVAKIAELGLEKHASIFDFTKEPFYVFERCDVVALPSFKEGLPNVLLEALAMETPCVASRIMGCPEVVRDGKTGYCFPAGDAQALADCLAKLWLEDKPSGAFDRMKAEGKQVVFGEHDKAAQFEKILQFIVDKGAANANSK